MKILYPETYENQKDSFLSTLFKFKLQINNIYVSLSSVDPVLDIDMFFIYVWIVLVFQSIIQTMIFLDFTPSLGERLLQDDGNFISNILSSSRRPCGVSAKKRKSSFINHSYGFILSSSLSASLSCFLPYFIRLESKLLYNI